MLWMLRPVERSMTVSAPQRVAHTIFSTSSATPDVTAELPILALILTRKLRPIAIGSSSGWLMFAGMMARPARHLGAHEFGRDEFRDGGTERLAVRDRLGRTRDRRLAGEVLAMRDIDHLVRDDAGAGELVLRDELAGFSAQHAALGRALRDELVGPDIAVVLRLHRPPGTASKPRASIQARRVCVRPAARSIPASVSV
jgi:hypothetical protein